MDAHVRAIKMKIHQAGYLTQEEFAMKHGFAPHRLTGAIRGYDYCIQAIEALINIGVSKDYFESQFPQMKKEKVNGKGDK